MYVQRMYLRITRTLFLEGDKLRDTDLPILRCVQDLGLITKDVMYASKSNESGSGRCNGDCAEV